MYRAMLLAFLMLMLIITSQFEWRQPLLADPDPAPSIAERQYQISEHQEAIKEKVKSSSHERRKFKNSMNLSRIQESSKTALAMQGQYENEEHQCNCYYRTNYRAGATTDSQGLTCGGI
ncbi:hypothetical protein SAY87_019503 [Trapa incisa]|uniref:Uncharacterized protein n=1 Tax=Trapa incisa TaxID=236973 RepID=A0AAN7K2H8_9MYRT|nr:hypothetical protein SAY87_019503 [Trapa incisa]